LWEENRASEFDVFLVVGEGGKKNKRDLITIQSFKTGLGGAHWRGETGGRCDLRQGEEFSEPKKTPRPNHGGGKTKEKNQKKGSKRRGAP